MNLFFTLCLSTVLFASAAHAANPTMTNLDLSQADGIMKNFSNAIVFRSLEPPSSNGKIWGFGIGVVGAGTTAKDVNAALPNQNIPALPAADIVGVLQGPFGIAFEAGFLPKISIKGFSAKRIAFNVKWTFTDEVLRGNIPFDAAFRFGLGSNRFSYSQTVSGVADTVNFSSRALRLELALSRKFLVFEPYIGLGMLKTSNNLSNTAGASNDLFSFTTNDSYSNSKSSFLFNLGTEIRMAIFTITPEIDFAYAETTAALKLALKF